MSQANRRDGMQLSEQVGYFGQGTAVSSADSAQTAAISAVGHVSHHIRHFGKLRLLSFDEPLTCNAAHYNGRFFSSPP